MQIIGKNIVIDPSISALYLRFAARDTHFLLIIEAVRKSNAETPLGIRNLGVHKPFRGRGLRSQCRCSANPVRSRIASNLPETVRSTSSSDLPPELES